MKKYIAVIITIFIILIVLILNHDKIGLDLFSKKSNALSNQTLVVQNNDEYKKEIKNIESQFKDEILNHKDVVTVKNELNKFLNSTDKKDKINNKILEYKTVLNKTSEKISKDKEINKESDEVTNNNQNSNDSSSLNSNQTNISINNDRIIDVPTTDEYKVIVNKKHALESTYNPGENPVAKKAFLKLKSDMQQLGYAVSDNYSGFRSYQYQQQLYERYVKKDGKEAADRYSARPGHSEHQTGLAFDLIDTSGELLGEGINDGATKWLSQNAYKYGFIVRYLYDKEDKTGYMPESWHIRFVGNDAKLIYESGLTMEEYYGVEGGDYR